VGGVHKTKKKRAAIQNAEIHGGKKENCKDRRAETTDDPRRDNSRLGANKPKFKIQVQNGATRLVLQNFGNAVLGRKRIREYYINGQVVSGGPDSQGPGRHESRSLPGGPSAASRGLC